MEIKRCTTSFATGPAGAGAGDLFPAEHPLIARFPGFFEPVDAYVARLYPEYANETTSRPVGAPDAKLADGEHVLSGPAAKTAAKKSVAPRRKTTPLSKGE